MESASSVTISNEFLWNKDESYVVEFETPSHIEVDGMAIEDVRALGIARNGQSPEFSRDLELSVIGAVALDFDRCGFGYQNNLHRISGADSNVTIEEQGTSLRFEGETGSVLEVVDTQVASNPESRVRAQMAFRMAEEFPEWKLELGMLGGIRVGNPADTFTLERGGQDSVLGRFDSGSGQSFIKSEGQDGEAIFFGEQLEFQMTDMSPDTVFTVEAGTTDSTCIIRWTGPGRCFITGFSGLPRSRARPVSSSARSKAPTATTPGTCFRNARSPSPPDVRCGWRSSRKSSRSSKVDLRAIPRTSTGMARSTGRISRNCLRAGGPTTSMRTSTVTAPSMGRTSPCCWQAGSERGSMTTRANTSPLGPSIRNRGSGAFKVERSEFQAEFGGDPLLRRLPVRACRRGRDPQHVGDLGKDRPPSIRSPTTAALRSSISDRRSRHSEIATNTSRSTASSAATWSSYSASRARPPPASRPCGHARDR